MIKKNNKTIEAVYHGSTPIEKIYKGATLVYEAWKNLTATGVPPLILANCKNTNLLDYKIYGESVQNGTPTPDTPVEIQSVGDKTKNLQEDNLTTQTLNGITFTNNGDGTITLDGTATSSFVLPHIYFTNPINIDGKMSIVKISGTTSNNVRPRYTLRENTVSYADRWVSLTQSGFGTLTEGHTYDRWTLEVLKDDVYDKLVLGLQVEEGSTVTDFEPYGYRIPVSVTPNQTKYNKTYNQSKDSTTMFDSNGNRIYPEDDMISIPSSDSIVYCSQYLATPDDATIQNYMVFYDENKNPISNADVTIEYINCPTFRYLAGYPQFMVVEGHKNQINIWKVKANNSAIKYMIMGCRNTTSTVTSYASNRYIGIEHDYNIYLNEPLRKIGDFADYLDYKNGKVVRNISRYYPTGNETCSTYNSSLYGWSMSRISSPSGLNEVTKSLTKSNMFNGLSLNNIFTDRNNGTKIGVASGNTQFTFINKQNFTSTTDLKTFLQNNAGVLYVDHVLATPIEESVTLPNILLNKGSNIVDVNTTIKPSNMYVEYKGGTSR